MPMSAEERYIKNERVLTARRQRVFTLTLSNERYEYLNTCCDRIFHKYGFTPTRQQQSEMVQKLFMDNKTIDYKK